MQTEGTTKININGEFIPPEYAKFFEKRGWVLPKGHWYHIEDEDGEAYVLDEKEEVVRVADGMEYCALIAADCRHLDWFKKYIT